MDFYFIQAAMQEVTDNSTLRAEWNISYFAGDNFKCIPWTYFIAENNY